MTGRPRLIVCLGVWLMVIGVLVAMAGCDTPKPEPIVKTVTVTLPGELRSCIPAGLREAPAYPDTSEALQAAAGSDVRYQLVVVGRALRDARLGELEPLLRGCR